MKYGTDLNKMIFKKEMSIRQQQSQSTMIPHSKIPPEHSRAFVAVATVIFGEPFAAILQTAASLCVIISRPGKRIQHC